MKELFVDICVIACKSLYLQAIIIFFVIELILQSYETKYRIVCCLGNDHDVDGVLAKAEDGNR